MCTQHTPKHITPQCHSAVVIIKIHSPTYAVHYHWHWQELPQVSFLSQQTPVCHDKQVFVMTKPVFCHDKSMLFATKLWCDKSFVLTSILLSRQKYACNDKTFVPTKLLRQIFVVTKQFFQDKSFVTNILLLQQKTCFLSRQTCVCHSMCLLRQKFCCNKNYTCGSSHQW